MLHFAPRDLKSTLRYRPSLFKIPLIFYLEITIARQSQGEGLKRGVGIKMLARVGVLLLIWLCQKKGHTWGIYIQTIHRIKVCPLILSMSLGSSQLNGIAIEFIMLTPNGIKRLVKQKDV